MAPARFTYPVGLALLLATASASPAFAEPPSVATLGVTGSSTLSLFRVTSGWAVCATGVLEDTPSQVVGSWTLTISGFLGTTPYSAPMWTSGATDVDHCIIVPTGGAATGSLAADFGYAGVGTYVIAHSVGVADWSPLTGEHATGVDVTQ